MRRIHVLTQRFMMWQSCQVLTRISKEFSCDCLKWAEHFGQQIEWKMNTELNSELFKWISKYDAQLLIDLFDSWERNSSKFHYVISPFLFLFFLFIHSNSFFTCHIDWCRLNVLVVSALWYRTRPIAIGQTSRPLRQTVDHRFDETGTTLHAQKVTRIIVELKRCY